ncbi:4-methylaminobutanoate oxidase (formaldehyde-forming) [Rhodoligotrophos appendicifer]|uniref:FAD-dependent oxidoreductase n=1 Tax=Rhodoligotrophos appendicifer TaxID=987056 RepID=UPI0011808D6E|nr:FAD-dependent oxidoreductase [Rhodoligotrophos appendicifer]
MTSETLPEKADAVVIGGGVVGAAMLHALVECGLRDVLLIERDQLGSGTTWHSAANIALIDVSTRAFLDFYSYNMELFGRLTAETGQEVGWRRTGRVQMATNDDRVRALKHTQAVARARGVESTWIGPEEIKNRLPILNVDDLIGGLWTPTVGRVNATDFIAALSKSARSRGAVVVENAPVTSIHRSGGAVCAVETARGTVQTTRVINCAGLWAPQIAEMVGVRLPIYANEHFYILTKPFPGVFRDMPSFRDSDGLIYGREDGDGLLLGCFETLAKPIAIEALPKDFAFGLLPEDWDQFEPYMVEAIKRIPALESAEVKMLLNGPESFTPDGRFIAGPVAEVPGFYVLAGMNSAGVNNAAGSSLALAQMILGIPNPTDLSPFSPTRFAPFHSRPSWLRERVSEAPGNLYSIGRVQKEFESGRNLRRSPFHCRLHAAGAVHRAVMGWERPVSVRDLAAEMKTLAEGAGLSDTTSCSRYMIEGAAAEALVTRIFGGLTLQPGECDMGLIQSRAMGVESMMLVDRISADRYVAIGEATRETADALLLRPEATEAVTVREHHSSLAALTLQGPRAVEVIQVLTKASLPEGTSSTHEIGGAEVRIMRHPWTGAVILLMASEYANYVADQLLASSADVQWIGESALEADRIRKAIPRLGRELVASILPTQSGVKSLDRGRFRPALDHGLLRGSVAGRLAGGEPLWANDTCIGFVSSASALVDGRSWFLALTSVVPETVSLDLEGDLLQVDLGESAQAQIA